MILIAVYFLFFRKSDSGKAKETMTSREEVATPSPRQRPSLVLFHSNGCGHCKHMMPAWQEFTQRAAGAPVDVFDREASTFDYAADGLKGFPTIRFYPNGYAPGSQQFINYRGNRSVDSLMTFLMDPRTGGELPPAPQAPPSPPAPKGTKAGDFM